MKFSPFFLGLLLTFNSFASECDLNFDYPNTGSNMTFFLTPSASSSMQSEGTIGAFYMDNEGAYHCAASANFHGLQTQLSVMADDTTTPEKDGFVTGETIFWFFQSNDGTMHAMEMHPTETYQLNAIIIVTELEVNELDCGDDQEQNSCETLNYDYINTGTNMTCALASSSISSITNLGNGTLGAFYANNQGELICAGSTSITAQETVFPIMGDDATTDEQDGLIINQELLFLFTNEEGTVYKFTAYPNKNFLVNDIYYVDHFEVEEYCNDTAEIAGCMDADANNYNANANIDDNSCTYDITGCTDSGSCNYNPEAVTDDGSCLYVNTPIAQDFPVTPADWGGDLVNINNSSLVLIDESNDLGCHSLDIDLHGAIALIKRGECQFSQKALNAQNAGASAVVIYNNSYGNLAMAAGDYATEVHIAVYAMNGANGSHLATWLGDNNSYSAQLQEHSLSLTSTPFDCNGNCVNDEDQDGICDEDEIEGCMDNEACNFNSDATDADDSCLQSELNYDCNGNCLNDADNDGVCDEDEDDDQDDCETLNFDYINTGTNMTCALASPAISSIANLGNGHLGAFYTNDEGELICAGSTIIDGQETVFPIMGNDATTDEQDGLINNQDLLLLFTNEQGTSYKLTAYPSKSFLVNDIYYVDHFEAVEYCNDTAEIAGCTDANANNFNSNANVEDNSCTYDVYGCTDAEANNFNSNANVEDNSCTYDVYGCMDADANNFNSNANLDDNSCTYDVYGCMDAEANNFNSNANLDDNSCTYDVYGCTDAEANNFNSNANLDDNSCTYDVYGCMDAEANNFNSNANVDDNSCTYDVYGCTDAEANNFNSNANVDDNSCTYDVYGCTDADANNYNTNANVDDNSCTYNQENCGCMDATYIEYFTQGYLAECDNGSCETPVQANGITSDHFNNPLNTALNSTIGFDLASSLYLPEGTVVGAFYDLNNDGQIGGSPSINSMDEVYFECVGLTDFQNNFFTMAIWGDDSFSDEVDGVPGNAEDVLFAFLLPNQSVIAFDFSPENFAFTPNGLTAYSAVNLEVTVYGCTNPASCNYNYYAEVDDGSCEGSYGCMEQMYVDYSSDASCHNQDMCADTWHDHLLVMESDYQEVMAALDSTISSNEDLSAALENQLELSSNLEIEMAAITLSLTQANQNMTELTENLEEAAANNANLEMVNEALEEANTNLTNLLNQANDALLSMEGEMIEVQADMVDANLTIDEMTTSMENLNAVNTEMQVEMAAANQTISNMTNAVDSLSSVNSEMQEGMSIANETISNMTNSMDSLSSVNSEMQEGMSIANETISNMTNSMDSLSSVNSEMEVGMTELENTNSEMSSMNESLQYELENAEENVVNLTIQTENLLSENDSLAAPINIDLNAGWNIIGYTLRNAQDAVVSFENVIENISVVKNNSGDVYWPDFGFNGIGDLLPGQGYQVLTFDAHNDFYFEDMGGLRTEIMPTIPQWAIEMEAAVHPNDVKTLVRVVNTLGQEVQPENEFEGRILYYLYNDGSVTKKVN